MEQTYIGYTVYFGTQYNDKISKDGGEKGCPNIIITFIKGSLLFFSFHCFLFLFILS